MKLRFTPRASRDIEGIADYLVSKSPAGAANVRDALFDAFKILQGFPLAGRRQTIPKVRKLITRKYSYLIYYTVDEEAGDVIVLTVQHPARRRPFQDT